MAGSLDHLVISRVTGGCSLQPNKCNKTFKNRILPDIDQKRALINEAISTAYDIDIEGAEYPTDQPLGKAGVM